MSTLYRNYTSEEVHRILSQRGTKPAETGGIGGAAGVERHHVTGSGTDPKGLYRWEIIPRDTYILIHTFPTNRIKNDQDAMQKHWDAAKFSVQRNLIGRQALVEWIDEVGSVCVSFFKVRSWEGLAVLVITDMEKDFYKRLGIGAL